MPKYYRITYDNIGIYEALKRKVDFVEWRNILSQSTWLPKPPMYDDICTSYFTEIGYKKFNANTMPIVNKYLDKDKINIEEVTELIGDILYQDKYQVVVRQVVTESLSPNKVKLSKDDFDENMYFIKTHAKTPKDLNIILNKFNYGYFSKEGNYYDENHTGDFSDYTTMDPHEVIKFAVGVCWDFAETEAYLFDQLFNYKITNKALKNGTYSLYYMEHDDSKGISPTHTWLAYMENDKVYLFESSWFKYQGIHEFNSEMEMIEFYDKSQRENESKKGNKLRGGIVIKYLPVRRYGLKPLEFMTHIYKCNTSRLMKVSPEFPIPCKIQPVKEDTDMIFNESTFISDKDDDIYFIKCKWEDGDKVGYTVNACKNVNGEVYRVRTEMLVVKDGKVLCVKDYHDNLGLGYKLPGGSVEKGVSYAEQAAEEVKEEARIIINPKSILDTGITYTRKYTKQPRWISHLTPPIPYVGGISYVYVGEYKSDFNGDIPDVHRDDWFYKRARFYDIDEINWIPEHKKALDMYLEKNMQKQDKSKDTYENALKVFNSLTPKEQYWLDDRYVDSPNVFYRKVHFIGRKPVGFVDIYRFNSNYFNPDYVIMTLAVNKAYRGKGIASDLVKSATLYCKSKGIKKIIWGAFKDNYASIQLAKKLGYTKTKEDEKYYQFEKSL